MKRKKEGVTVEDGVNFDCGGPLGCSEEVEKRRKSTAARNLSDLSFIFPFMVKLASQEVEAKPWGTGSHSKSRCFSKLLGILMVFLDD